MSELSEDMPLPGTEDPPQTLNFDQSIQWTDFSLSLTMIIA